MAEVRLQGIACQFDGVTAVEDITLEIPDGEFWVLVGPSGCGKSTLLRAIAGLESPSRGEIYIGGVPVNHLPARQRDVAMVFQNYALYPHMTVAENLAFGLRMRGTKPAAVKTRIVAVARSLNLEPLLQRKPRQLSGGQQQRVALGRAIIREPKVFLLDEPLSNLDAQLRDETRAELKALHARLGITTIYVTHDQVEAMTLADCLAILDRGRLQQVGRPQAVYARPANRMVAKFLGSPPMNVLPVSHAGGRFFLGSQDFPVPEKMGGQLQPQEGQPFDLGIRAEDLAVAPRHFPGPASPSGAEAVQLAVEVDVVEPLGRETLVRGKLPDSALTLNFTVPPTWEGRSGERVAVQVSGESLFIFDPEGGQVLYPT